MTKKKAHKPGSATIALNKRARHEYFIEEEFEAGLALQGWEVKSLRAGKANISDSYVLLRDGEAFLFGANITPMAVASTHVVCDPTRTRKLLLNQRELDSLYGRVNREGYTVVALPRITQKEMTEREQRELKTLLDRARIAHGRVLTNSETNS
eukprot:375345_1